MLRMNGLHRALVGRRRVGSDSVDDVDQSGDRPEQAEKPAIAGFSVGTPARIRTRGLLIRSQRTWLPSGTQRVRDARNTATLAMGGCDEDTPRASSLLPELLPGEAAAAPSAR